MLVEVDDGKPGRVGDLDLPEGARAVCRSRRRKFSLADAETTLKDGDEVLILTHSRNLSDLTDRFIPEKARNND